ncbi:MAG: lipoate--protein ligase family protein [Gloeocapsa sp. DLM2.Bin57]|nr:MAG: lipoate--protein ligase family protein [Gloeocapsa sp. DLM2.Bin57]
MQTIWRYLPPITTDGRLQMAIDSWLLEQHRLGKQPPCIRFYTWSRPTISLGYHQHRYPQHWQQLEGIDLVRRPTGGRAVLHEQDLTYMIVISGLSGRITDVYQYLCQFLIKGWRSLGLELNYGHGGKEYLNNPNCLATSTPADLVTSQGQKLIGSALLKQGNYYLQHGSIQLSQNTQLFTQVFGTPPEVYPSLNYDLDTIINALVEAVKDTFEIELKSEPLSAREWQEIKNLLK